MCAGGEKRHTRFLWDYSSSSSIALTALISVFFASHSLAFLSSSKLRCAIAFVRCSHLAPCHLTSLTWPGSGSQSAAADVKGFSHRSKLENYSTLSDIYAKLSTFFLHFHKCEKICRIFVSNFRRFAGDRLACLPLPLPSPGREVPRFSLFTLRVCWQILHFAAVRC